MAWPVATAGGATRVGGRCEERTVGKDRSNPGIAKRLASPGRQVVLRGLGKASQSQKAIDQLHQLPGSLALLRFAGDLGYSVSECGWIEIRFLSGPPGYCPVAYQYSQRPDLDQSRFFAIR